MRPERFDTTRDRDYKSMVSDDLFPSGPWTGFYNYAPGDKHRMDLHLTFAGGKITGEGNDDVGRFVIGGGYDAARRECQWTKTYPGSHNVYYQGFREGKGIWGTWEIGAFVHGGFHIWPKAAGEGEDKEESAEATAPVEAVGKWEAIDVPSCLSQSCERILDEAVSECGADRMSAPQVHGITFEETALRFPQIKRISTASDRPASATCSPRHPQRSLLSSHPT